MKPGIYSDLSFADYLAVDAASKSRLWTLYNRTPAHVVEAEDEATPEQDFGTAAHCAILEPHKFDAAIVRGPVNRQGNKWKEALAEHPNSLVLPEADFEKVLRLRDAVMLNPTIRAIAEQDGLSEASAFYIDEETGELCRVRPDRYIPKLALMADLKTTTDASEEAFWPISRKMGYHLTDAMYSDGWTKAGGGEVEDYIFVVIERDPPFAHQIFQMERPERELGYKIMRQMLPAYAHYHKNNYWPGYPNRVTKIHYPEWVHTNAAYKAVEQEILHGTPEHTAA